MTDAEPDDEATLDQLLIQRWRDGDERSASAIVERHGPALARFAQRLGVRDDIEDVVQETFIRAFGALDGFRSESSLRTWLFTIARRLVIDRQRSSARTGGQVQVREEDAVTGFDALDALVADETARRVAAALGRLSRLQREVFLLRVQDGTSYRDIAEILGTTEGAARVHYHNAMRAVKEFLHA
jgi:RNA polymerase sigma-70 factor (ECF subfamily)